MTPDRSHAGIPCDPALQGRRVLVVGLDGADFALLAPLMDEGRLPNLSRLRAQGACGGMLSTHPPVSAPAWASFTTGVWPGKHGVVDFMTVLPGSRNPVPVNAQWVKAPRVWHRAGEHGLRSICVNIPLTYPPQPLNGLLVGGPLVPHPEAEFTYPATLKDDLVRALGPYRMEPSRRKLERAGPQKAAELAEAHIRRRLALWLHLMKEHEWDLFLGVFRAPDLMQHAMLRPDAVNGAEPSRLIGPRGEALRRHYELLDECTGEVLAAAPDNTSIFVVSDHGFGLADLFFCVGEWLEQEGLLVRSALPIVGADLVMIRWRSLGRVLRACRVDRLGRLLPPRWLEAQFPTLQATRRDILSRGIDWRRTLAAPDPAVRHGIRINLRGRDPRGVVSPGAEYERLRNRIIQRLGELRHPETGEPFIENAWRREELYDGPYVDLAPDIVIRTVGDEVVPLREYNRGRIFAQRRLGQMAVHKRRGILLAAGPDVRPGTLPDDVNIVDPAPTMLHLLGLPVPADMDGRVLTEMLRPEALAARPVAFAGTEEPAARALPTEAEVDERVVARLRDLGYLD